MFALSVALILLAVGCGIVWMPRYRGIDRTLLGLAMLSLAAMGAVSLARARGELVDANLYVTLNIALPVLFCGLLYQIHLRKKMRKESR